MHLSCIYLNYTYNYTLFAYMVVGYWMPTKSIRNYLTLIIIIDGKDLLLNTIISNLFILRVKGIE